MENRYYNIISNDKKIGFIHMNNGYVINRRDPTAGAWFNYEIVSNEKKPYTNTNYIGTSSEVRLEKLEPAESEPITNDDYYRSSGGRQKNKKHSRRHKKKRGKRTRNNRSER
jgi:hypothetical protein